MGLQVPMQQGGRAMLRRIGFILGLGAAEAILAIGAITHVRAGISLSAASLGQIGHTGGRSWATGGTAFVWRR